MSCINNRAKEHYKFDQAKQHFFLRRPSWQRLSEGGATFYINIIHIELRYAKQHEFWYTSNGSLFQKPRSFSEKDWWHKPSTLMLSPRFIFIFTVFSLLSAFSFFSWQQPGLFSFPLKTSRDAWVGNQAVFWPGVVYIHVMYGCTYAH